MTLTTIYTAEQVRSAARNIFCVGRNYSEHAAELGNAVPDSPMIFGKSTHALAPAEGTVVLPKARGNIHHEIEIVLFMANSVKTPANLSENVFGIGLGIDFTDRDAQNVLKTKGHPWEYAKGFKNSAVVTGLVPVSFEKFDDLSFSLRIDGDTVQTGAPKQMIFSVRTLVDYVAEHFGLGQGDLLFTGTPSGVGPVADGQKLELVLGNQVLGSFDVKFE